MDAILSEINAPVGENDGVFVYGTPAGLAGSTDNVTVPNAGRGDELITGPTFDPRLGTSYYDDSQGDTPMAETQAPMPTSAVPLDGSEGSNANTAQQGQDASQTAFTCDVCQFWMSFDTQQELDVHYHNGIHFDYVAHELDDYITRAALRYGETFSVIDKHIKDLSKPELSGGVPPEWLQHCLTNNKAAHERLEEEYLCYVFHRLESRERPAAVPADRLQAVLSTLDRELDDWHVSRFGTRCNFPSLALFFENLPVPHQDVAQATSEITQDIAQATSEITVTLHISARISGIPIPHSHLIQRGD